MVFGASHKKEKSEFGGRVRLCYITKNAWDRSSKMELTKWVGERVDHPVPVRWLFGAVESDETKEAEGWRSSESQESRYVKF